MDSNCPDDQLISSHSSVLQIPPEPRAAKESSISPVRLNNQSVQQPAPQLEQIDCNISRTLPPRKHIGDGGQENSVKMTLTSEG